MRYYIDTCIYLDYLFDRQDRFRPLGEWALRLLMKIKAEKGIILFSDVVQRELLQQVPLQTVKDLRRDFSLMDIAITSSELEEASRLNRRIRVSLADVQHAVLARNHQALLITRDRHFQELSEIAPHARPEDLL